MRSARLGEAQSGIKITRRNINKFRYEDENTHDRKQRGTKEALDESDRGE